jgi:hypothetical protein
MKFFIASPWRNKDAVTYLAEAIRTRGHTVYSFIDCGANLTTGRSVVEEAKQFYQSIGDWENDSMIGKVFASEMYALRESDVFILLEPAGHSSLAEAGIAYGMGKQIVLVGVVERPEIVYRMFGTYYPDTEAFLRNLEGIAK